MEQPFFASMDQDQDWAAKRCEPRDSLFLAGMIGRPGEQPVPARIRNLSGGGLMAECAASFAAGEPLSVEIRGVGPVTGRVAWVGENGRIGMAFDRRIDPALARRPVADSQQPMLVKASTMMRRPGLHEPRGFVPARKFR